MDQGNKAAKRDERKVMWDDQYGKQRKEHEQIEKERKKQTIYLLFVVVFGQLGPSPALAIVVLLLLLVCAELLLLP